VLTALALAPTTVAAQETPNTFEFSFSNPGARSLGLGGAFVALADDATAAFANPAGLVQLIRPEISAEGRYWSYSTPYTAGGRYEGVPTGLGLDTVDGAKIATSNESTSGLSFLSFVYPSGRWSLAVYRHQLAKFGARTETQGLFHMVGPDDARQIDRRWATDLDIVGYGLAGGYRLSDRFSLGLGIVYFEGQMTAPFEWNVVSGESLETIFGPNPYDPARRLATGGMYADDTDWGWSAGALWSVSDLWSIGGFYRQGPELELTYEIFAGPLGWIIRPSIEDGTLFLRVVGQMAMPDVYGLGVAYRSPDGKLAVSFEWDRVEYSSILGDFTPVQTGGVNQNPNTDLELTTDDGDEFHLGGEYVFLNQKPVVALRGGLWLDPDHRFRSTIDDAEHRFLFPPGEDALHVAIGLGFAFTSFQIDLAADFSDLVDTVSLSAIHSF
jgi:long-subunit fatty acid transport protein